MPGLSISSPGKTILFGEHAVVYGYPAIAVPLKSISLKVKILPQLLSGKTTIINAGRGENLILQDLSPDHIYNIAIKIIQKNLGITTLPPMQIWITSSIPVASGLGSSAAFAVSMTKSIASFLGFNLNISGINEIAFQIETHLHGSPSGIDNTVIAYSKPVFFRKESTPLFIELEKPLTLLIADTGIRSSTKEIILELRLRKKEKPVFIESIFKKIGEITECAKGLLINGDGQSIGKLMTENHSLLQSLGLSCKELDHLVITANNSGATGAKLCGGGKGGNIVALADGAKAKSIKEALLANGAVNCLITVIESCQKDK